MDEFLIEMTKKQILEIIKATPSDLNGKNIHKCTILLKFGYYRDDFGLFLVYFIKGDHLYIPVVIYNATDTIIASTLSGIGKIFESSTTSCINCKYHKVDTVWDADGRPWSDFNCKLDLMCQDCGLTPLYDGKEDGCCLTCKEKEQLNKKMEKGNFYKYLKKLEKKYKKQRISNTN